ncbi:MAG: hypothetical protein RIA71_02885 [Oceanicaulis sp.]
MAGITLDLEAHKLIEVARLDLDETQLSIIKRALRAVIKPGPATAPRRASTQRETGQHLVRLGDRQSFAGSQKQAYLMLLTWLSERSPSLLEALGREETRRGRRIVARSPQELYPREGLDRYAEAICDGWWADLNLSKLQKQQRLRIACRMAGVSYGAQGEADAEI